VIGIAAALSMVAEREREIFPQAEFS